MCHIGKDIRNLENETEDHAKDAETNGVIQRRASFESFNKVG